MSKAVTWTLIGIGIAGGVVAIVFIVRGKKTKNPPAEPPITSGTLPPIVVDGASKGTPTPTTTPIWDDRSQLWTKGRPGTPPTGGRKI